MCVPLELEINRISIIRKSRDSVEFCQIPLHGFMHNSVEVGSAA
jgi:hypothetical protein